MVPSGMGELGPPTFSSVSPFSSRQSSEHSDLIYNALPKDSSGSRYKLNGPTCERRSSHTLPPSQKRPGRVYAAGSDPWVLRGATAWESSAQR
ncbi:hypothetical protein CDAR_496521 [Caerostris darwini]|uniref:Uncharacterized protein n=1 Tax=Caerostris darwini TaxID=1538125 RepID=A0AAV4RL61_9ARAC|nr:hypothetical protein CDAR_496521 [Caerostris darwini]